MRVSDQTSNRLSMYPCNLKDVLWCYSIPCLVPMGTLKKGNGLQGSDQRGREGGRGGGGLRR